MFGVFGQIMSGVQTAREYDSKKRQAWQNAKLTRMKGAAAKRIAYDEARSIYETDKANKEIRAQQQRQARGKQTQAQSAARNAAAGSGVIVEQGATLEDEVRRAWDAQIDNMAESSSIMHINAMQRALNEKKSGDAQAAWAEVEAIGYDYEAEQYRQLAKRTRSATLQSALVSGLSAALGGYAGYNAKGADGDKLGWQGAMQGITSYGIMGWDVAASMNPYTAGMQVSPKTSWTDLADLLRRRYVWDPSGTSTGSGKNTSGGSGKNTSGGSGKNTSGGSGKNTSGGSGKNTSGGSANYGVVNNYGGDINNAATLPPDFYNQYQAGLTV